MIQQGRTVAFLRQSFLAYRKEIEEIFFSYLNKVCYTFSQKKLPEKIRGIYETYFIKIEWRSTRG